MHLIFDISTIVARPWLDQPTGIDRVEMAHARHWRSFPEKDVTFVSRNAWGQLAALPDSLARTLLDDADQLMARGMSEQRFRLRARSAAIMYMQFWGFGRKRLLRRISARPDSILLVVSYSILAAQRELAHLRKFRCRFAPLIHDLIPISHPQYFPLGERNLHVQRLESLAYLSDAGFAVSNDVLSDLEAYSTKVGLTLPPMTVVYSGLDLAPANPPALAYPRSTLSSADIDPYFLILGTLEPRKNHLLMLQLWQQMASLNNVPRLVIVGRNPAMPPLSARVLERISGFHPTIPHLATTTLDRVDFQGRVEYRGRLNDHETAALLKGARALLFPSLAEGFGLPLAEALAAGVPAIVSDIAVFREHGGDVPEYVDPLDGPGWKSAILQYAEADSPQRAAQLERMKHWRPHTWQTHFETVQSVLETVAQSPQRVTSQPPADKTSR